jgi:hypothetical protein
MNTSSPKIPCPGCDEIVHGGLMMSSLGSYSLVVLYRKAAQSRHIHKNKVSYGTWIIGVIRLGTFLGTYASKNLIL